ncbi:MAG: hypothetical protein GX575_26645 [Candidatus Anammoximicrobium sp.]|nr:hypothetical protein [Candidatus Anammoximicrobium sp.]
MVSTCPRWFVCLGVSAMLLVAAAGCAIQIGQVGDARELYYRGQAELAVEQLDKLLPRAGKDADVICLDLATAQLFAGYPQRAEQRLREVRDRFDYLEQKDLTEAALSYVLDDNQRAYAGEDYEKVLIRVMLALANLMGDGGDAEAYSLQVTAKQRQIIETGASPGEENPKAAYQRVAVGAYLHGVLREATHGNYDDAERAFATVVSWQPGFSAGGFDLERVRQGRHSAPGNGVLYLFAFVGRGPYKREASEVPTSAAMLIADRILSTIGKHSLPPTLAPIKVPQVVRSENQVDRVLVSLGGQPAGTTDTVTDVGQLAVQQYQAIYPHVLGRAVARRAVKKAAVYAVKEQIDGLSGWGSLALDVAGVVWEATESADTRCWTLLPDTIQVLRLELPAGEHTLGLRPCRGQIPVGGESRFTVGIEDGRNCYALACFPDAKMAGQVLVSGR